MKTGGIAPIDRKACGRPSFDKIVGKSIMKNQIIRKRYRKYTQDSPDKGGASTPPLLNLGFAQNGTAPLDGLLWAYFPYLLRKKYLEFFNDKINPIKNKIPTGQKSWGEPEKLCRQFQSPTKLNIARVFPIFIKRDFIGFSLAKIETWPVLPKKSSGWLKK